ncbi:outer membrane lipoprotein carrier protein LolA [uncultured Microbulbifer sp.]|uniref:outer membrane lipoprotein carrier protein LolA n=1 Tax=uncultured Microbulbifer sp. TaxID=348147 RepID=UPI0025D81BCE|nr:outer membrane lipoprotein carrier protein LolA [uncultured Microbulbifer sp.]
MKILLASAALLSCVLFMPSAIAAEQQAAAPASETEIRREQLSQAALQSISVQLQQPAQMLGEFRQKKILPNLPRPLQSSGVIALSQQHGISWHTKAPVSSHRIMGKGQGDSGGSAFARHMGEPMMHILRGDFAALQQMFYVDAGYIETADADLEKNSWKISLQPRSPRLQKYLKVIELFGTDTVHRIRLLEGNQAVTEIELLNMQDVAAQDPQLLAEFRPN